MTVRIIGLTSVLHIEIDLITLLLLILGAETITTSDVLLRDPLSDPSTNDMPLLSAHEVMNSG
jgi:hypothetical protein